MVSSVVVFGAGGRMGAEVCRAVLGADDFALVGAVDPTLAGTSLVVDDFEPGVTVAGSASDLTVVPDVAVDFTVLAAARENMAWMAAQGVHGVIGTSGFDTSDFARFSDEFASSNCVIAPNFTIGAVLMMRFAELAAPYFETAEIVEYHHENKVDAPSGTAMATMRRMAAASSDWLDDPTEHEILPGARGGRGHEGIRVHSVRLRGAVANQEVVLGTSGQTLSIRHDSFDRSSYMGGVLLAMRSISTKPGLTVGLDALLGL